VEEKIIFLMALGMLLLLILWMLWKIYLAFKAETEAYDIFESGMNGNGYQPTKNTLDVNNPPLGGSGVPHKK